jgi:hypothetical protein
MDRWTGIDRATLRATNFRGVSEGSTGFETDDSCATRVDAEEELNGEGRDSERVARFEAVTVVADASKLMCPTPVTFEPEGEVLPIGPGMLGPTLGPCRPEIRTITPMAISTREATTHNVVGRRLS